MDSFNYVYNSMQGDEKKSLLILSIPALLTDPLAEKILQGTGIVNAKDIVKKLQCYPVWHKTNSNKWVFHQDIRDQALKLNDSNDLRKDVFKIMSEFREDYENSFPHNTLEYDLELGRLALTLDNWESVTKGIWELRRFFNIAEEYNQPEIIRVINLFLEEKEDRFYKYAVTKDYLPDEISCVYFMCGSYAYRKRNYVKALYFLTPVCVGVRGDSNQDRKDDAIVSAQLMKICKRDLK